ncbi:hypothetical protein BDE02_04G011100 [Populus trichocarpa]|nr:hypothetical protein BDE02_04G011100 [Populus trichocarpa]
MKVRLSCCYLFNFLFAIFYAQKHGFARILTIKMLRLTFSPSGMRKPFIMLAKANVKKEAAIDICS